MVHASHPLFSGTESDSEMSPLFRVVGLLRVVRYGMSWMPRLKSGRRRVKEGEAGVYGSECGSDDSIDRS